MKSICVPASYEFLSFDRDIGRLIAIAEYPNEAMLVERMQHDWQMGRQLLWAVKEGALRVRDGKTRMPLEKDAPWLSVHSSVVSIDDFQRFAFDLGYQVVVVPVADHGQVTGFNSGHGTSPKLNDCQRAQVVKLFHAGRGVSVNKLAKQFGVTRRTIDKVLQNAGFKVAPKSAARKLRPVAT